MLKEHFSFSYNRERLNCMWLPHCSSTVKMIKQDSADQTWTMILFIVHFSTKWFSETHLDKTVLMKHQLFVTSWPPYGFLFQIRSLAKNKHRPNGSMSPNSMSDYWSGAVKCIQVVVGFQQMGKYPTHFMLLSCSTNCTIQQTLTSAHSATQVSQSYGQSTRKNIR